MEVHLGEKSALTLVGISCHVRLKEEREQGVISQLCKRFEERIVEIHHRVDTNISYGVFIDPPDYNVETDEFKWICGVEVSEPSSIPEGMEIIQLPANKYASVTYEGSQQQMVQAYDFLYKWVNESEYKLADHYGIEVYNERVNRHLPDDQVHHELSFPITSR